MEKHKKLSKTLKKTIIQETVGNSFTRFLDNAENSRDVRAILNLMVNRIITEKAVPYISIEDYIRFFKKIPLKYWATRPIFYKNDDKYDALGFLGERVHACTLITKTLAFYYHYGLGMNITHVLDNIQPEFIDIENPKDRMLESLNYLKENTSKGDLNRAYFKAKKIMYGRYN
mgnify:CR=1 FL=1